MTTAVRASSFRPLRRRQFALLWSASLVSNVGTWMQTVAVGALVTAATGQARWTALVAAAAFLPIGVLAPVGGAVADRTDRRRWIMAGNAVEAGLAALLAVLSATGRASPGAVTAVVFLAGSTAALMLPVHQALVPDLVGPEDVLAASSLGMAQYNLGRVLGPALGALVVAVGSFTLAFALNAVSFLVVVAAAAALRVPPRAVGPPARMWRSIADGARAAWREPACRSAISLIVVAAFLLSPFIALLAAKARLVTDGGAQATAAATGAMTTAQGVGAVVGALTLAPLAARFGRRRVLVGSLAATSAALCVYAATPTVATAVAALVLVGAVYIGVLTGLSTVVLVRAPTAYRARVSSLFFMALGTVYPLGALVHGALADRVGLATVTVGAAVAMLAVLAALAAVRPGVFTALDEPASAAATDGE